MLRRSIQPLKKLHVHVFLERLPIPVATNMNLPQDLLQRVQIGLIQFNACQILLNPIHTLASGYGNHDWSPPAFPLPHSNNPCKCHLWKATSLPPRHVLNRLYQLKIPSKSIRVESRLSESAEILRDIIKMINLSSQPTSTQRRVCDNRNVQFCAGVQDAVCKWLDCEE
jgi:hypothetical protein